VKEFNLLIFYISNSGRGVSMKTKGHVGLSPIEGATIG
jgi:hypothetical protein